MRGGQSRVVVLEGEAGLGKTALLEYAADRAAGFRSARASGMESEMELAYAGLHQLCSPMLDQIDTLPAPQGEALAAAFGLSTGDAPDPFLIGLAVLSLLAGAAEERPLLCLIDDAQWLDVASVEVLAFVARRLQAESVACLFALRDSPKSDRFDGLPHMSLEGLSADDSSALLRSATPGPIDERVLDRIISETRGNPLALLELPRGLSAAELAGGFGLPPQRPLPGRIERSFHERIGSLPMPTQRLLLIAAADPTGEERLLWQAADLLGIGEEAASAAEDAGLVTFGHRVTFRHPLVRSAVYRMAPDQRRREAHRALAEATDPERDPDRRAWHRAEATLAPDEGVADELERSAERAAARGGLAAAAAFLERATTLTPDVSRRTERALRAAQAEHDAGASNRALRLIDTAEAGSLDEAQRGRSERLRAQIAFAVRRGDDAPLLLLNAARRLEVLDPQLARETYLEALAAAIFAGRLGDSPTIREVAEAAASAPPASVPPRAIDLLLDGLAKRFTDGYAAGLAGLQRALRAFSREDPEAGDRVRWLWLACRVAPDVWDDERWHQLADRQMQLARQAGALAILPVAATYRAGVHVHAGEFASASELIHEANDISKAIGSPPLMYTSLVLAAWRGDEEHAAPLIEAGLRDAAERGEGRAVTLAQYATAVLCNGLARYEPALASAQRACEYDDLGLFGWALVELVEAASRSGEPEVAADALVRLSERTELSAGDWALGLQARSRAFVSVGSSAESAYAEAIDRLGRCRIKVHLARSSGVRRMAASRTPPGRREGATPDGA